MPGIGSQQKIRDPKFGDESNLDVVEEVSVDAEEEDDWDKQSTNRRLKKFKAVRNDENRTTMMHGPRQEAIRGEANGSPFLCDSEMKVYRYSQPNYESGRKRRKFYLPSEEDDIDLELRSQEDDGQPGHRSPRLGMSLTKSRSKSVIAPPYTGDSGPKILTLSPNKRHSERSDSMRDHLAGAYEVSQDMSEGDSQKDKYDGGPRSHNSYQDYRGVNTLTQDATITLSKDGRAGTIRQDMLFSTVQSSPKNKNRPSTNDKEAHLLKNRQNMMLDTLE